MRDPTFFRRLFKREPASRKEYAGPCPQENNKDRQRCCQTKVNGSLSGMVARHPGADQAAQGWRHSARAAARFSLKFCRR